MVCRSFQYPAIFMNQSITSPTYQRFREMLIKLRKQAGVSQVELAGNMGRPQQFVSRYELGERRIDVGEFIEISKHLGFEAGKFIDELATWDCLTSAPMEQIKGIA